MSRKDEMYITANTDNIEIGAAWERSPASVLESLSRFPVALIGDVQNRMGMMASSIAPVTRSAKFAGSILPILTREGDNLAIHRGIDEAKPGDVLVINGNGETYRAVFGEILGEICVARGIAAVVIDGATRDVDELDRVGIPVFARGVNPAGPTKTGPGSVGFPVACGHVVCNPGDAIFGDRDGVIVVPRDRVASHIPKIEEQDRFEAQLRERIRGA
jgi:regulator of RNase E activity RraA